MHLVLGISKSPTIHVALPRVNSPHRPTVTEAVYGVICILRFQSRWDAACSTLWGWWLCPLYEVTICCRSLCSGRCTSHRWISLVKGRSRDDFSDISLNKSFNIPSNFRWFETLWRQLWCHYNGNRVAQQTHTTRMRIKQEIREGDHFKVYLIDAYTWMCH